MACGLQRGGFDPQRPGWRPNAWPRRVRAAIRGTKGLPLLNQSSSRTQEWGPSMTKQTCVPFSSSSPVRQPRPRKTECSERPRTRWQEGTLPPGDLWRVVQIISELNLLPPTLPRDREPSQMNYLSASRPLFRIRVRTPAPAQRASFRPRLPGAGVMVTRAVHVRRQNRGRTLAKCREWDATAFG